VYLKICSLASTVSAFDGSLSFWPFDGSAMFTPFDGSAFENLSFNSHFLDKKFNKKGSNPQWFAPY